VIATIVLGVALFSTITGLNEIEMTNTVDYFNSDFTELAFADPKDSKHNKHHDPRLYVNTLSYNNAHLDTLDSCDSPSAPIPCLKINPRITEGEEEIFIADPELQSTQTAISVTIIEKNEFNPDLNHAPHCLDQFRAITSFTVSTFNGIHGVFLFCDNISFGALDKEKIFDVTYTFITPAIEDTICDCDKPSNLLLQYDGPDPETVTIEIYKKEGEVGDSSKLLGEVQVVSGNILLQSENLKDGKDKLESNTVFRVMNSTDNTQIAVLSAHTSCSKPLFISQEFTANPGDSNMVVLTILDGTDTTGQTTIPESFCPVG